MSQDASPHPPQNAPHRVNRKAAGVIGLAVACSRVLGLVRELVFAKFYGAGPLMDAFVAAFRAPNLLRDLFAEGALSTAFITVFSKKIAHEGDGAAWRLASKIATLTCVFMSLVTLLGIAFAPGLIHLLAGGFPAEKLELTIRLTRIMFPFILLVSLAALAMGMLNAKHIFGMPAMASCFFNLGSILGGVGLAWWLDPHFGERALTGLALGTLIGGLLQLGVQFPALWRVGFRFRPDFLWRDAGVRHILLLMGPAVIAASAVQVNVMVNGRFASGLGDGPTSWLAYAFRLMQLPLGIFGVAVGTVALPAVAKLAAKLDFTGIRSTLGHGVRLAFFLTAPCTVGLIFLAAPIISLIFERGKFGPADTLQTAAALQCYALGLAAYSGIKVIAPAFYALNRRHLPMLVSFLSIVTNYALNYFFTHRLHWGHRGLAFSTSLVAVINFTLLYWMMARHLRGLESRALGAHLGKLLLACVPLAGVCLAAQQAVFADLHTMGLLTKTACVLGTIGAAAAVFAGAALLLKMDEVEAVRGLIRRRLGWG